MSTFITILGIVAFSIVVLVVYNVLKTYVLHKIKVNKWVILGLAMVLFVVPTLAWPTMPKYVANYVIPGVFVFLFLWFMDLSGFIKKKSAPTTNYSIGAKKDKKADVVMRPKVKPNRIKNNIDNKK
ncbi:hypothetical protein [Clostridium sp. CF012]|uniref:hypothetical protein n=1 Tax=Clostridium sp. CF012 TaxID=2843319 RepID=UPI001C0C3D40|nr:hypothetical protein [Clostridium sp. CF012]MBU3144131.1 hypothetical protein [Clostridium sp. CF012]